MTLWADFLRRLMVTATLSTPAAADPPAEPPADPPTEIARPLAAPGPAAGAPGEG